jgi:DNA-3-methyladenine glycosylase II
MFMDIEASIKKAEAELSKIDPRIGRLIAEQGTIIHYPRTDYFASLCRSILGQQVSVASAAAMYKRLEDASGMKPLSVVGMSDDECRAVGLSRQKAGYIRDLARHFVDQPDIYNHLENQSDDEVIAELTEIKGIGVWTAQMFLMFTLTRLDVFASDDVGIQRGMKQFFKWETLPKRDDLITAAEKWKPYRTIACWHLWESLNNTP